ncbi:myo-inositol-1(or 4)-monophosphatase [Mumia flava]|uniref:Inositol-1-monophosphatase n=1 Tax=Mumia flava TaxID=1348852 RepID=A0A0B2BPX4_9ACTN|nr:inositol monophosphatase family protein [Mumia flava]PJJ53659.1 myo-inositol-1(or 4)-monophosphatase [Mumia flava]
MSEAATTDPEALVTLASTAARAGAAYVRTHRGPGRVEVAATKSSPTDPVTEIDRATERVIREHLLGARPDDGFLGEEGGLEEGSSAVVWVVDPIDGTVNFVYGIPAYAVSIAARVDEVVEAACVLDVVRGEEFTATRGHGAFRRESPARGARRLQAVPPPSAASALVGTGFNYVLEVRRRQAAAVGRLLESVRDVRRTGSAALDLCGLAAGRLDAYVEQGLQPWDLAAGGLIAHEAGVELAGLDGEPDERLTMAAPAAFAGEFFALVRACGF